MRLLLLSVIIISCKPATRTPTTDLHAITDGQLMLGTVAAIAKRGKQQVYRLLVCKNDIETENSQVYNDDNSCRPALVNQQQEIVLFPNHLQRGFVEKYKGRIKRATIGTLVALPFLVAIPIISLAGKPVWKYVKKLSKEGNLEQLQKFADRQPGLAKQGNQFYQELYNLQTEELSKFATLIEGKNLTRTEESALANILNLNGQVYRLTDKTTQILKLEDQHQMLLDLKQTGQQLSPMILGKQEEKFLDDLEFKKIDYDNQLLFNNILKFLKGNQDIPKFLKELETTGNQLLNDAPRYYQLFAKNYIIDANNLDEALDIIDKQLIKERNGYDKLATETEGLAKNIRDNNVTEVFDEIFEIPWFAWGAGLVAGSAVLISLNESIWGHGDRQASRYWNKIFYDSYNLDKAMTVKDLPVILQSLAKTFSCQVNSRALMLANTQ